MAGNKTDLTPPKTTQTHEGIPSLTHSQTHEDISRREDIPSSSECIPSSEQPPRNFSGTAASPKRTADMDQKISCELCKTRKVKCDRAEPSCSWCARHNRPCVYLKRQAPGSRTRINAELEAKVSRIDGLLRALGQRVEEHIAHDHAGGFVSNGLPSLASPSLTSQGLGSPTAVGSGSGSSIFRPDDDRTPSVSLSQQSASSMVWESSGPANSNNNNDYDDDDDTTIIGGGGGGRAGGEPMPPPSHNSDDMQTGSESLLLDHPHQQHQHRYPSFPLPLPRAALKTSAVELPPHDMLYTLVDLFFKHCNTWCPILDRKTIFGTFFGATSLEEPDRVLLHAIVATTLRFSKDARLTPEVRNYYHSTSSQVVRLYAMDHITVPALRALVIVSLDEFGRSSGPRAWNLLAMVTQNVRQLGLCDEVSVYLSPSLSSSSSSSTTTMDTTASNTQLSSSIPPPPTPPPPQHSQHSQPQPPPQLSYNGPIHQSKPDSWIEDEGRRRLCWVVYLLDRYATVCAATMTSTASAGGGSGSGGGGGFLLEDQAMRRFLPCSYDLFSKNVPVETRSSTAHLDVVMLGGVDGPTSASEESASSMANKAENLGSFSYHCKLLRILSRIHDFLRDPVDIASSADMARWRNTYQALDATLDGWLRGLPSEFSKISALCHSDPASRVSNWFMLHSAYVTAVVRLHAPAAYPTARSTLFMPSQYAVQRCLSAVHSLADIARDLREANGLDLLGPPFAFSLWVAARVLLVHASTVDATSSAHGVVDGRIDFFIETLRHVGRHWEVANNYAATLARVAQRGRQGEITFANMRRSAYDLLALTSTTRQSGAEPMSTQVTSLCELDNIDVFAFFVYPPIEEEAPKPANGHVNNMLRTPMGAFLQGTPHRGSSVF